MSDEKMLVSRDLLVRLQEALSTSYCPEKSLGTELWRTLLAQPSDGALTNDLNQCDGCRAGKPLENGNRHRMGKEGGYPDFMSCTAKLYKPDLTNEGAEPVAWNFDKPTMPGAYWIRGNGLEAAALVEVKADAEDGLRCNLHMRNSETDFGWGYSMTDLSCAFEWLGPLTPPAPVSAAPHATCTCPSGDGSLRWPCPVHPPEVKVFQARVQPWMTACFGEVIASDRQERNHRFLEEALELVQACGATIEEAHQLVDYVYGRAVGEPAQEVGGVMVTLAALCLAQGMDMHQAAEVELTRIWTKVEQIRAKQLAKPAIGPLPGVYPDRKP